MNFTIMFAFSKGKFVFTHNMVKFPKFPKEEGMRPLNLLSEIYLVLFEKEKR